MSINGAIGDVVGPGKVTLPLIQEVALDMQPEELSEGKHLSEESGFVTKDEFVSEEVMQMQNCTLKELSDFSTIESTKDKISEADPNLERSMTICQSIEKMLIKK